MHIFVGNLTIIGSDHGLSPDRRQAITWTNAGILLIGPQGTNFSETFIAIHAFSFENTQFENVVYETSAILSWPQCVNRLVTDGHLDDWIQVALPYTLVALVLQQAKK